MRKGIGVLLIVVSMTLSSFAQREIGCAPFSESLEYGGIPADVNAWEFRVVRARTPNVSAVAGVFPAGRRLWVSSNAGRDWTESTMNNVDVTELVDASGASRADEIYLLQENGHKLLRSHNGGQTWESAALKVHGLGNSVQKIEVAISGIADLGTMLYGSVQATRSGKQERLPGIYVSRDRGDTWDLFSSYLEAGSPVAAGSQNHDLLFGVADQSLVRSDDGGQTWKPVGGQRKLSSPVILRARQIAIRRLQKSGDKVPDYLESGIAPNFYQIELVESTQTVFVRSNRGLLISHDLGLSWCQSEVGANILDLVNGLAISESDPQHIMVSTRAAKGRPPILYLSGDSGKHFQAIHIVRPKFKTRRGVQPRTVARGAST